MPRRTRLRNSGGVPFLTLKGHFLVRANQQPDGDTIAFAASKAYDAGPVSTNIPVDTTGATSKNIRLQSTDAPEKAQPLGASSRDGLLKHFGFNPEKLGLDEGDFHADGEPVLVEGWLATHGMDNFQRPLGYVFADNPGFSHSKLVSAADVLDVLKESGNYSQVATGRSFPAFYENTDETHAALFAEAARKARDNAKGVWEVDATTEAFVPMEESLASDGSLVFPKFYRRVAKWQQAKADADAFIKWLKQQDDGKKLVQGAKPSPVPLWELFEKVSDSEVAVPYDVTRLWFSE